MSLIRDIAGKISKEVLRQGLEMLDDTDERQQQEIDQLKRDVAELKANRAKSPRRSRAKK